MMQSVGCISTVFYLIQIDPFFNWDKQEPDWKTAVQIWNHDHVDGKTIFDRVRDPINVISKILFINYTSSLRNI